MRVTLRGLAKDVKSLVAVGRRLEKRHEHLAEGGLWNWLIPYLATSPAEEDVCNERRNTDNDLSICHLTLARWTRENLLVALGRSRESFEMGFSTCGDMETVCRDGSNSHVSDLLPLCIPIPVCPCLILSL
jgi:hypothetical protein